MDQKTIRIKDIALKAKVSPGTVDRVIHNRGKVAEKVRIRIQKIIDESNYEPNLMARALGSKKQYRFAALIPDHQVDSYWLAPKTGIEKAVVELKQFGVSVRQFIFNPYDANDFIKKAEELTATRPDGIFLSPIFYHEVLPFLAQWHDTSVPFVLFNTEISDHGPLSYIGQDSYQSGKLAGKLMHYGQSEPCSILIVHIDEKIDNAAHLLKKEEGLRDYFSQQQDAFGITTIELDSSDTESFNNRLAEAVDGIADLRHIFVTTSKAHLVAAELERRQLGDIRIIGYDLVPANLHYLEKGSIGFLINQNPERQGYLGIRQLADFLVFRKAVSKTKFLPLDIITLENLRYYLEEDVKNTAEKLV
ncbi:LacI family transcriptional regulator [Dyadobacter sp. BE34]|uniref:LacI family transcriptional regulator n=1 Tax=Dyadobacter fermentans TaxID=94254 RepID=A0ABU1QUV2_9BACT|nr:MULTISPECIES: substrate-binding domain-containing protein [Dyadobacter]MDR6804863.1 LacI family transcriptional regulator [Dyadobacter fermentans]MDR7043378.1 LacI family transcriptional regulator [Dyadobacter sp. BE242]MDR7197690.1 LacI family transcriptional regulator [Dyadobacter sp. BE34]MDR7214877.1 LacI family transcriptional regulator [Dyadobacter sp. BE31]MDR7262412.1 LacI family transcriptional regulator [Dyadobacter sp. BE32]